MNRSNCKAGNVGRSLLIAALLFLPLLFSSVRGEEPAIDSLATDSTLVSDSAEVMPPPEIKIHLKATSQRDSLLRLLPLRSGARSDHFDFAQMSSRFDYDPLLVRVAQGPWGEGEQLYPLGLAPGSMSRADPLFGDAAIANPVPVPQSEEAMRIDQSQDYYLLSPALAGVFVPFSRATAIYQPLPEPPGDSARSKLYVRRGRYAYANTEVTFANQLGNWGSVNLDANFIKLENQLQFLDTRNDRTRLILAPNVGVNSELQLGFFFNRTHADRPFLPGFYLYEGRVTDNYSGVAASFSRALSDSQSAGLDLRYRNDDQTFESSQIYHRQRFRIYEAGLHHQLVVGRHNLHYEGDIKLVDYQSGTISEKPLSWRIALGDLLQLQPRLILFGQAGLTGVSGLKVQTTLTGMLRYELNENTDAAVILSRQAILPTAEQRYLPTVTADFGSGDDSYFIGGNPTLRSGSSLSIEAMGSTRLQRLGIQARGGYTRFTDLPSWHHGNLPTIVGAYSPVSLLHQSLLFGTVNMNLTLPWGMFASAAYGARQVASHGSNYTYGPEHELDGFTGIRFWFDRFQIIVTAAVGGKYRSNTIRYLDGSSDTDKFVAESFLSFDLKRFHFFWNYTNLLDTSYSLNGRRQPGRSHWWGFSWEFFD